MTAATTPQRTCVPCRCKKVSGSGWSTWVTDRPLVTSKETVPSTGCPSEDTTRYDAEYRPFMSAAATRAVTVLSTALRSEILTDDPSGAVTATAALPTLSVKVNVTLVGTVARVEPSSGSDPTSEECALAGTDPRTTIPRTRLGRARRSRTLRTTSILSEGANRRADRLGVRRRSRSHRQEGCRARRPVARTVGVLCGPVAVRAGCAACVSIRRYVLCWIGEHSGQPSEGAIHAGAFRGRHADRGSGPRGCHRARGRAQRGGEG